MHIKFDKKLTEYVTKKGYAAITVDVINCVGCCADTSELATAFVKEERANELKAKGAAVHQGDGAEVLILAKGLYYDDEITFSLRNFFGAKDVNIEGLSAFKL